MSYLLDADLQRKLKLVALFNHSGWKLFEEELKLDLEAINSEIDQILRNPVVGDEVQKLNLAICKRNAVLAVFDRVVLLQEELDNSPDEA